MNKVKITTDYITLAAFLKFAGAVISGGVAKEFIAAGMVKVNGVVCTQRGKKLYTGDSVAFDGRDYEVVKICI